MEQHFNIKFTKKNVTNGEERLEKQTPIHGCLQKLFIAKHSRNL